MTEHTYPPVSNPNYHFEQLQEKHIDEVCQLFTDTFVHSEPMTHYLHMDQKKYSIFAREVTEKAAKDGLSIVAMDKDKIIACALVEDINDAEDINADFDNKFSYILALLGQLGENFFQDKKFPRKHIAHLFITAVKKEYRRQGLSTQINYRALDLAADAGYDFAYCEFTNIYCERGTIPHLHTDKKLIGSCVYHEFTFKGKKPFAHLKGSANSYLWPLHPEAKLTYEIHAKKIAVDFSDIK